MIPLLLVLACTDPDPGTVVGNPGNASARLAPTDDGVGIDVARAFVDGVELVGCDGTDDEVEIDEQIDLLVGELAQLPGGSWCSVYLSVEGGVWVEGRGPTDQPFELDLPVDEVTLEPLGEALDIDGQALVVELAEPGWLGESQLDQLDDDDGVLVLAEDSSLAGDLVTRVELGSAIFEDLDADGDVGSDDRAAGALAAGAQRTQDLEPSAEPTGQDTGDLDGDGDDGDAEPVEGGCGSSDSAVSGLRGALVLPVVLLGWRRRGGSSR